MNLSLADWLGIAALVVALVVGAATVLAARQWGNRRRKILFTFNTTALLPKGQESGPLQITYHNRPVKDPHLVAIHVKNIGPSDIGSQQFDGDRSLKIKLNCTMYGLTSNSHPSSSASTGIADQGVLELRPQLLRRGEEWTTEAVVEGEANPELDNPLIDTDTIDEPNQNLLFKVRILGVEFRFVSTK